MRLPFLCLALALATAVHAAEPALPTSAEVEHPARWRDLFRSSAFSVLSENDKYFAGTDRHYTNGLKFSFMGETRVDESPELLQKIVEYVPTLNNENAREQRYKVGVSLGQDIFTPVNTQITTPQPNDRPYAGWLYGALTFQAQSNDPDARLLRVVEIAVGIVGPSALGRQTQSEFHRLINVETAKGWAHQLRDEPGLMLSWERRYRVGKIALPVLGLESDLIVRGGLTLGNVRTHAASGFAVRLGWRLPRDFGADLIRPAGGSLFSAHRFSAYFTASAETRAVAHNIFLDGNTWRDSLSVDKRPIVADLNLGLVLRVPTGKKSVQLAYMQNYRTKEFYGQLQHDVFGSVGISLLF